MRKFHFYHNQEHQEQSSATLSAFLQLISVTSTNRPLLPDPFSMFPVQLREQKHVIVSRCATETGCSRHSC